MAYSFEQENGLEETTEAEAQSAQEAAVDQVVQEMEPEAAAEVSETTDYMSEVLRRLEMAQFYNSILQNPLFTEGSETAEIVEQEIRSFVKERLEILLGMKVAAEKVVVQERKPTPADALTEPEVQALRMVASKLIRKPELATAAVPTPQPPKLAPVVRQAPVPPPPAPVVKPASALIQVRPPVGAKPGKAKPKAAGKPGPKAPAQEEVVLKEHPDHPGHMVEIHKPKRHKPAGYTPFPVDNNAMGGALLQQASRVSSIGESTMPVSNALAQLFIKQG
jgi:hypothetical protein